MLMSLGIATGQQARSYEFEGSSGNYAALEDAVRLPFVAGKDFHASFFGKDTVARPQNNGKSEIEGIPFFDFDFCGQSVNSFGILSDGILILGKDRITIDRNMVGNGFNYYADVAHILNYPAAAQNASWFQDAEVYASATEEDPDATSLSYKIEGEEGSRILTVEFRNIRIFLPYYKELVENGTLAGDLSDTLYRLSYQIRLYETDGNIEILYDCPQPLPGQSMAFSSGLKTSSSDKLALENTKGEGWESISFSSTSRQSLMLNDSIFPVRGFTASFSKPGPCQNPGPGDTLTDIRTERSNSTGFVFSGKKPDNTDRVLIFLSQEPVMDPMPQDGTEYKTNDLLGNSKLIGSYEYENISATPNNLESGTYYLHIFQANYLCSGTIRYSLQPQTVQARTLYGPADMEIRQTEDTSLVVRILPYENEKVLVAISERAWDENLDGNQMERPLVGKFQVGDTLNKDAMKSKGYPAIRVIHAGEASTLTVPGLKPSTPYYFTLWSYQETDNTCKYSSTRNIRAFRTLSRTPLQLDFSRDAVQNLGSNLKSLPVSACGWTRTIENTATYNDNFGVSIGTASFSEPKSDRMKRLELYANYGAGTRIVKADAVSPEFILSESGKYRIVSKIKAVSPGMGNLLDAAEYPLSEGDTLFIEISADQGSSWIRIDTLSDADKLHESASDAFGFHSIASYFDGKKNDTIKIRLSYITGHKHKFCINALYIDPVGTCDMGFPLSWKEETNTGKGIRLSWEAPQAGTEDLYELQFRRYSAGTDSETWQDAGRFQTNRADLPLLEAGKAYEFRVRKYCSGTETSAWSLPSPVFYSIHTLPLEEDFDNLRMTDQEIPDAWMSATGKLQDTCSEITKVSYNSWGIGGANLTGDNTNGAAFLDASRTEGCWLLLPGTYVSQYPVRLKVSFDYSIAKYAYPSFSADSIVKGKRSLKFIAYDETGCFRSGNVLFRIDTAATDGYALKGKINTPAEFYLNASGRTRFAFYWENLETDNADLSQIKIYIDNLKITYPDGQVYDSVYDLQSEIVSASSARISWKGDAPHYALILKEWETGKPDTLWTEGNGILLSGLRPQTGYAYCVRPSTDPRKGFSGLASSFRFFQTPESQCQPPTDIRCIDSSVNSLKIAFRSTSGQNHFRYGKEGDPSFLERFTRDSVVLLTELEAHTSYQVKIRSVCAAGDTSVFSLPAVFKTKDYPECPVPSNLQHEVLTETEVWLTWNDNPAYERFEVEYKEKNGAQWTVSDNLEENGYLLSAVKKDVLYVWAVKAYCTHKESRSQEAEFILESGGNFPKEETGVSAIRAWYSGSEIRIINPDGSDLREIGIFNLNGQAVLIRTDAGNGDLSLPFEGENGLYLVRIRTEKGFLLKKISIVR